MFKEILQIVPQLSSSDLNNMENQLGKRFTNIAKKFGKGLTAVLGATAGAGIALALIDKLLNPLKEVQAAIDATLHKGDDLADQAKQFNTTAGELAKLQAFGKSKGLEASEVNTLLVKFQGAVAEAVADPTKNTSVRQFTGEKNTAQAFLTFIQGLSKLDKIDPNKAIQVQQEVFGEKQIGKTAGFLRADFDKLDKDFSKFKTDKITKDAEKLANLNELSQSLEAQRGLKDLSDKAQVINKGIVLSKDQQETTALTRENQKISQYEQLAKLQNAADGFMQLIEAKGLPLIGNLVGQLFAIGEKLGKIANSRMLKYFGGGGKDDK